MENENQVIVKDWSTSARPFNMSLSQFSRGMGKKEIKPNEIYQVEIISTHLRRTYNFSSSEEATVFYLYTIDNLEKLDNDFFPVRVQKVEQINDKPINIEYVKIKRPTEIKKEFNLAVENKKKEIFSIMQQVFEQKKTEKEDALSYYMRKREQQENTR